MDYIFEDETTPMQQIVINNPGTIVIQSPSFQPTPIYNDEIDPQSSEVIPQDPSLEPAVNNQPVYPYEDEVPEVNIDPKYNSLSNPTPRLPDQTLPPDPNMDPGAVTNNQTPFYNDELPPQDVAQQDLQNIPVDPATEIPVQQPFYNDEQPSIEPPVNPQETQLTIPTGDTTVDPSGQQVVGQPQMAAIPTDPNAGLSPVQSVDPTTGMPPQPTDPSQIDPTTGMPIQPPPAQPGTIDPLTGMPVPGGMGMDGFTDEANPDAFIGNSSAVAVGAPVPLQDLSRLNELKTINSHLMRIKGILEKELSKPYNSVEDKLNEAIEYFRSIISNLDSFSMQIDDIIMKYKRFILTILTQINILKKEELDEKHGAKKINKKEDNKKKDKDKK